MNTEEMDECGEETEWLDVTRLTGDSKRLREKHSVDVYKH